MELVKYRLIKQEDWSGSDVTQYNWVSLDYSAARLPQSFRITHSKARLR